MSISIITHPRAVVVSLGNVIQPSTVNETLTVLLNGTDRSFRVLFDIRHLKRMRTEYLGALVHLNTRLRSAGFHEPIGLWIVDRPYNERALLGARINTVFQLVRSTEQATRFVRV